MNNIWHSLKRIEAAGRTNNTSFVVDEILRFQYTFGKGLEKLKAVHNPNSLHFYPSELEVRKPIQPRFKNLVKHDKYKVQKQKAREWYVFCALYP